MTDALLEEISTKLNVLIALSLRQLSGEKQLESTGKRKAGAGELVRFLSDLGLEPKDIAQIVGSPISSVRTLLTPTEIRRQVMVSLFQLPNAAKAAFSL